MFPITLPPLRQRAADIPLLVRHFVKKYSTRFNRVINSVHAESLQALERNHWPGNIRELENLVERSILTAESDTLKLSLPNISTEPAISLNDVLPTTPPLPLPPSQPDNGTTQLLTLAENERAHIKKVLQHTGGRISGPQGAAEILGLPASTLRSRMKKLGLT